MSLQIASPETSSISSWFEHKIFSKNSPPIDEHSLPLTKLHPTSPLSIFSRTHAPILVSLSNSTHLSKHCGSSLMELSNSFPSAPSSTPICSAIFSHCPELTKLYSPLIMQHPDCVRVFPNKLSSSYQFIPSSAKQMLFGV